MTKETSNPEQWLNDHGDYLYRYGMSKLHNEEQAADMVQETLLAAWRGWNNFAGNSSVRTWLVGILKHKIIDHIRKEIRDRNLTEAVETDPTSSLFNADGSWVDAPRSWKENPEDLCGSDQFQSVLQECIGKLPDKQQIVFTMREVIGEDSDTICKEAEVTSTHLHVLIHRARLALRTCLEFNWFGGSRQS
ncbi:MAG TPA: sigma-70 family RNA polymerase sigma factor [Mariprofundaceae bacterium]|nr:sigma-70 family RNA polymerase sigma factor [Mariprofundaceae bacterium]